MVTDIRALYTKQGSVQCSQFVGWQNDLKLRFLMRAVKVLPFINGKYWSTPFSNGEVLMKEKHVLILSVYYLANQYSHSFYLHSLLWIISIKNEYIAACVFFPSYVIYSLLPSILKYILLNRPDDEFLMNSWNRSQT